MCRCDKLSTDNLSAMSFLASDIHLVYFFFFLINCSTSSTVFKGYRLVGKLKKIPFRDTRRMDIKPFQILSVLSTPLQNAIWYSPATTTQNSLHRNGTGGCL